MSNRRVRVVTTSSLIPQASFSSKPAASRLAPRTSPRRSGRARRDRVADTNALVTRVASRVRADRKGRTRAVEADDRAELMAFVAHELRTPLTSVMGYTAVLLGLEVGDLNEQQVMMLERVAVNGGRLLELVERLLDAVGDESNLREGFVDVVSVIEQATGGGTCGAGALRPSA